MNKLPSFRNPPVTEVVLSIQFNAITSLRSIHMGMIWGAIRAEFPNVTEHPPIPPAFETFGQMAPSGPGFIFPPMMFADTSRYWFGAADGVFLLQLQQDRLIMNWRKQDENHVYPRYGAIKEKLVRALDTVAAFLSHEKLGVIAPNQCEVSYVNAIRLPDGSNPHDQIERVYRFWQRWDLLFLEEREESASFQLHFVLRSNREPVGRVHLDAKPSFLPSGPILRCDIIARSRPLESTVASALSFLDFNHEALVRTFADVTSPELHAYWEKEDE